VAPRGREGNWSGGGDGQGQGEGGWGVVWPVGGWFELMRCPAGGGGRGRRAEAGVGGRERGVGGAGVIGGGAG